jgi:DNA-binding FadR family transcriptional regulator
MSTDPRILFLMDSIQKIAAASMPSNTWARRTEKVASQVARTIARDIADRSLGPGTALEPESVMIDRYQVSRASLREALRILETQGLISIKPGPGGGPLVSDVSSVDFGRMATLYFQVLGITFRELVDARLIIEPLMAGLAAKSEDVEAKELLVQISAAGWGAHENNEWLAMSDAFHAHVLSMSGNDVLNLFARSLKDVYTDRVSGLLFPETDRDHVRKVHDAIAKAIMREDAARARRLMEEHMREYADAVQARYPTVMDELVDWR